MVPYETIRKAYARLEAEGIRGVLVGSAALSLHGFTIDFHDLDFLCERGPKMTPEEESKLEKGEDGNAVDGDAASSGLRTIVDGVPVDYIDATGERKSFNQPPRSNFFTGTPLIVEGIPVASLEDIIGLKRAADREKDRVFLRGWDAARSRT